MSRTLSVGLPVAVVAAGLYGTAPIAQAAAARRSPTATGLGLRFVAGLVTRPIWLLGIACELGGFVAEAYAFSAAAATLVAPVMACDTMVFVALATLLLGQRLARSGLAGVAAMAAGVAALAFAFSAGPELGSAATDAQLLVFLGVGLVLGAIGTVAGSRASRAGRPVATAVAFAGVAGICYGGATIATRQVGLTFTLSAPWRLLTTPTPYILLAFSVVAVIATQRALQANPVLSFPVTSVLAALLPVVVGAAVLGDPAPSGGRRVAFVFALLLIVAGVALLGRERVAAQRRSADGQPRQAKDVPV